MSDVKKEWRDLNGVSLERKTYPEGSYYFVNGANINREVGCALWEAAAPCREDALLQLIRQWKEANHRLAFPVTADAWKELDRILDTLPTSAAPCRESGETDEARVACGTCYSPRGRCECAQPPDSAPRRIDPADPYGLPLDITPEERDGRTLESVQRYHWGEFDMEDAEDGNFVHHVDYIRAAARARAEVMEKVLSWAGQWQRDPSQGNKITAHLQDRFTKEGWA